MAFGIGQPAMILAVGAVDETQRGVALGVTTLLFMAGAGVGAAVVGGLRRGAGDQRRTECAGRVASRWDARDAAAPGGRAGGRRGPCRELTHRAADAHRDSPVPGGGPAAAGAVGLDGGDQAVGGFIAAGTDQDLVEHHVVEDFQPGLGQRVADPAGLPACGGPGRVAASV